MTQRASCSGLSPRLGQGLQGCSDEKFLFQHLAGSGLRLEHKQDLPARQHYYSAGRGMQARERVGSGLALACCCLHPSLSGSWESRANKSKALAFNLVGP